MSKFDRTFCATCKEYMGLEEMPVTVHLNGKCIHHEEDCDKCSKPIFKDQGRYRVFGELLCEVCRDKQVEPRMVF